MPFYSIQVIFFLENTTALFLLTFNVRTFIRIVLKLQEIPIFRQLQTMI